VELLSSELKPSVRTGDCRGNSAVGIVSLHLVVRSSSPMLAGDGTPADGGPHERDLGELPDRGVLSDDHLSCSDSTISTSSQSELSHRAPPAPPSGGSFLHMPPGVTGRVCSYGQHEQAGTPNPKDQSAGSAAKGATSSKEKPEESKAHPADPNKTGETNQQAQQQAEKEKAAALTSK
jgi:hypothetical protein